MKDSTRVLTVVTLAAVVVAASAALKLGAADSREGAQAKGFVGNIDAQTKSNKDFRRVLYTGKDLQLVLMSLKPGEEIGAETHENGDQFIRVEKGRGEAVINGVSTPIKDGSAVLIPAGAEHNIKNTGKTPMRLYTLYGPPQHEEGTLHETREKAGEAHEHFSGKTTE